MKLSPRNRLKGKILDVNSGATTALVRVEIASGHAITASMINEAVEELGLKAGAAIVVIKASDVMIGVAKAIAVNGSFLIAVALLAALPALAQEPVGCDKFKWPVDHERALLANPSQMASGAEMQQPLATAVTVVLVPYADTRMPVPPSRAPKSADSYAGFINAPAVPKPGTYRVTLSAPAWIDVIQNGDTLQSTAFSGVSGCPGIAKSVKFQLTSAPFVIELSNTAARDLTFVVTPD